MGGGRSDFLYTTGRGTVFALNQDTSNGNVASNLAASNGLDYLPRNIKPRYGMYADQGQLRHRKVYAGTEALLASLPLTFNGGDESGTVLFTLLYVNGEKARYARSVNTGIIP